MYAEIDALFQRSNQDFEPIKMELAKNKETNVCDTETDEPFWRPLVFGEKTYHCVIAVHIDYRDEYLSLYSGYDLEKDSQSEFPVLVAPFSFIKLPFPLAWVLWRKNRQRKSFSQGSWTKITRNLGKTWTGLEINQALSRRTIRTPFVQVYPPGWNATQQPENENENEFTLKDVIRKTVTVGVGALPSSSKKTTKRNLKQKKPKKTSTTKPNKKRKMSAGSTAIPQGSDSETSETEKEAEEQEHNPEEREHPDDEPKFDEEEDDTYLSPLGEDPEEEENDAEIGRYEVLGSDPEDWELPVYEEEGEYDPYN
jgi:hypothetical protein